MNRSKLLTLIKSGLTDLGFQSAPGTNFGATALLFKRLGVHTPLLMMVAVRFARADAEAFTGCLCISRTLRWSLQPSDCPAHMRVAIPDLLTEDERDLLLDDELCDVDQPLGWWRGFRSTNAARFVEAVKTTVPRMAEQEQLRMQVERAPSLQAWSALRRDLALARQTRIEQEDRARAVARCGQRYVGMREALVEDGWLDAAEKVWGSASMRDQDHNPAIVRHLAQEAWTLHRSGFNLNKM